MIRRKAVVCVRRVKLVVPKPSFGKTGFVPLRHTWVLWMRESLTVDRLDVYAAEVDLE